MAILLRIGLFLLLFSHLVSSVSAQPGIIATPVVDGAPAVTQDIGNPYAVAADGAGGFYFSLSYQNRIYKVAADGSIKPAAGIGTSGFSGDGGPATAAQLNRPKGIAVDSAGNLYIVDSENNRVRKVSPAGIISTVAGNGTKGFSSDSGLATVAQLNSPHSVAVDSAGNLYILDAGQIRKVVPAGTIGTVAKYGPPFGAGRRLETMTQLKSPRGVAVDSAGNLYLADFNRILKMTPAGIISTVAGKETQGFSGDNGRAIAAQLSYPVGVAVDSADNLFIADAGNNRIRKVTPAGIISTVAGNWSSGYSGDGGTATRAELNGLYGVAVDSAGNLYIADTGNRRIRKVTAEGIISTVAGNINHITEWYRSNDFYQYFAVFGGAGATNPSGNAAHGSIHLGANFEISDVISFKKKTGIPAGFLWEFGYAGPVNDLGNGSALISANYLAEGLVLQRRPLTAFTTVGYTRLFGTGNALNFGVGIKSYINGQRNAVRFEVRDYFQINGSKEHNVAFRIGYLFGMDD
jgi:sugar lactone lactonase YvrE